MRVVCVHGIGKQVLGEELLSKDWLPALRDGLGRAGHRDRVSENEVGMAFYGDVFRRPGIYLSPGDPLYKAADVEPGLEQDLLAAWWTHAAEIDPRVAPPGGGTLAPTPKSVQRALRQLSNIPFFADVAFRAMVFDLKQVARYLTEPDLRLEVRSRVTRLIGDDTRVVVAHSLGSVVAYEALCATVGHGVRALVTLGSPLGMARLVFDRLDPAPTAGRGVWPGGDDLVWTNIADDGDVVAAERDLRAAFGPRVRNARVYNGVRAHSAVSYLSDVITGDAVAEGLE